MRLMSALYRRWFGLLRQLPESAMTATKSTRPSKVRFGKASTVTRQGSPAWIFFSLVSWMLAFTVIPPWRGIVQSSCRSRTSSPSSMVSPEPHRLFSRAYTRRPCSGA